MAATVLSTKRAIEMSVFVVRAFVRLRDMLATNGKVAGKLAELEHRLKGHDESIQAIIEAIHELMAPAPRRTGRIGFRAPKALKAR
jgi:hypothetical protein